MGQSKHFTSLTRRVTGIQTARRTILIAVGFCLACLGLIIASGDIMVEPTDSALAAAVATGA